MELPAYWMSVGTVFGCLVVRAPLHNFIGAPAVANGHVYLGANDGYVYVFDALSGALQWRGVTIAGRVPSPVVVDGA